MDSEHKIATKKTKGEEEEEDDNEKVFNIFSTSEISFRNTLLHIHTHIYICLIKF